jgi:hypothetical protein
MKLDKDEAMQYLKENMVRDSTTQLAIKAYKVRKTIPDLTYKDVATRFYCSVRTVRQVNELHILLEKHNIDSDEVFDILLNGDKCTSDILPWLKRPTSSISGILRAFKENQG